MSTIPATLYPGLRKLAEGINLKHEGSFIESPEGTSFAAPHVTGVAALVLSANSLLTSMEIRQLLRDTAEDLGLTPILFT